MGYDTQRVCLGVYHVKTMTLQLDTNAVDVILNKNCVPSALVRTFGLAGDAFAGPNMILQVVKLLT